MDPGKGISVTPPRCPDGIIVDKTDTVIVYTSLGPPEFDGLFDETGNPEDKENEGRDYDEDREQLVDGIEEENGDDVENCENGGDDYEVKVPRGGGGGISQLFMDVAARGEREGEKGRGEYCSGEYYGRERKDKPRVRVVYFVLVPCEVRHHAEGCSTADEKDDLDSEEDGCIPTIPPRPSHHYPINDRVGPHCAGPRSCHGGIRWGRQFGSLWRQRG